jgi:hypothetical protein
MECRGSPAKMTVENEAHSRGSFDAKHANPPRGGGIRQPISSTERRRTHYDVTVVNGLDGGAPL